MFCDYVEFMSNQNHEYSETKVLANNSELAVHWELLPFDSKEDFFNFTESKAFRVNCNKNCITLDDDKSFLST